MYLGVSPSQTEEMFAILEQGRKLREKFMLGVSIQQLSGLLFLKMKVGVKGQRTEKEWDLEGHQRNRRHKTR